MRGCSIEVELRCAPGARLRTSSLSDRAPLRRALLPGDRNIASYAGARRASRRWLRELRRFYRLGSNWRNCVTPWRGAAGPAVGRAWRQLLILAAFRRLFSTAEIRSSGANPLWPAVAALLQLAAVIGVAACSLGAEGKPLARTGSRRASRRRRRSTRQVLSPPSALRLALAAACSISSRPKAPVARDHSQIASPRLAGLDPLRCRCPWFGHRLCPLRADEFPVRRRHPVSLGQVFELSLFTLPF